MTNGTRPFVTWPFAATGASAVRTLPDRLSDIISVLDWGAGAGGDVTSAIQAAIDYCINTKGGGKVFFPPGTYSVSNIVVGSNSADVGVQLIGSGLKTSIVGNNAGWIISSGGLTYDCLELIEDMIVQNNSFTVGSGCIRMKRDNVVANMVILTGWYGIDVSQASGAMLCSVEAAGPGNGSNVGITADNAITHGFVPSGTVGIALGNGSVAEGCRSVAHDIAYALGGSGNSASAIGTGISVTGSAAESNNIGYRIGWGWRTDLATFGEIAACGCSVMSTQNERTDVVFDLYNCTGGYLSGLGSGQGDGVPEAALIDSAAWDAGGGGIVTVNTTNPHNMIASPYCLELTPVNLNYLGAPGTGNLIKATSTGASQFTYPLTADPGAWTGGTWKYPMSYCLRCRKVYETEITTAVFGPIFGKATVDLDYEGASVDFRNNVFSGVHGYWGWIPPSTSSQLAGWKFINCTGVALPTSVYNNVAFLNGTMVFNDLPTGAGTQPLVVGQQYDISDGAKSGGGVAGFGDIVEGAGTGKYLVRYNGTNWIRIG